MQCFERCLLSSCVFVASLIPSLTRASDATGELSSHTRTRFSSTPNHGWFLQETQVLVAGIGRDSDMYHGKVLLVTASASLKGPEFKPHKY